MANQNITIPVGKARVMVPKAFDVDLNDVSNLVTFTVVSSDPTIASVANNLLGPGQVVRGLKVGVVTITTTAADASGSVSETDTINVVIAAPVSLSITYGIPQ